jgi:hypothetical protein
VVEAGVEESAACDGLLDVGSEDARDGRARTLGLADKMGKDDEESPEDATIGGAGVQNSGSQILILREFLLDMMVPVMDLAVVMFPICLLHSVSLLQPKASP